MTLRPSTAERLDRALDQLLSGVPPRAAAASAGLPAAQHPLLDAASSLRAALAASVVAPRLGARLSGAGGSPWILRHPGRLIVGGAVGSAVGVGVTAYAMWRTTRRAGAAHRLLHR
jgi:hypothetical protein